MFLKSTGGRSWRLIVQTSAAVCPVQQVLIFVHSVLKHLAGAQRFNWRVRFICTLSKMAENLHVVHDVTVRERIFLWTIAWSKLADMGFPSISAVYYPPSIWTSHLIRITWLQTKIYADAVFRLARHVNTAGILHRGSRRTVWLQWVWLIFRNDFLIVQFKEILQVANREWHFHVQVFYIIVMSLLLISNASLLTWQQSTNWHNQNVQTCLKFHRQVWWMS